MNTLTEIVDGLADQLRTIAALDHEVLKVVRRPQSFPAAIIVPPAIPEYGLALAGGGAEFTVPVMVLVGSAEAENQASLFPFLDWTGASSVPAAIEADRTLGGLNVDAHVDAAPEPAGLVEFPDGVGFGTTFNVLIIAS